MLSPVFDSWGRRIARAPRRTVLVWVVLAGLGYALAVVGLGGETLFDRLETGAPAVPGSESSRVAEIVATSSTTGASLTLAVEDVDPADPALPAALEPGRTRLTNVDGVATVIDPYVLPDGVANPAAAPLLAADGRGFLVVVELDPELDLEAEERALEEVEALLRDLPGEIAEDVPGATGRVGGSSLVVAEITDQVEEDLRTGETIALPVALVVMVVVFGGFLAAAMPIAGALASIGLGLGAVYGLSHLLELDTSVVNVVTLVGLGLSIDYGLLVVSRFREELRHLVEVDDGRAVRRRRGDGAVETALRRTLATAGRTVAFSALTVAVAVGGLLGFEPTILRAYGAAGVAVILVAVATALTLVPALLRLAGRRLVRPGLLGRVPGIRAVTARTGDVSAEEGAFSRLAGRVQRRPWRVLGASLVVLGVLALPVAHLELRSSTIELLPPGSDQREYVETIAEDYPDSAQAAVLVVATAAAEEVTAWSDEVAALPGVASVDAPVTLGGHVLVGVRPAADDPAGPAARAVVERLRALDAPFPTYVGGQAAAQIDFVDALAERAGPVAAVVVGATLLLLFLMTGSVLVPIKALVTTVVSLGASLGVLVWVFQDGHLADLLGFVPTGGVETYVVALVVAFGFGLATDYEVFLLSRVKEHHDAGADNDTAVRLGLQRSGRIITAAAAIIVVVFAGFVFGDLLVIKEVGFALAVAVVVDATVVRLLLVPATMTLLGRANWWAPRPLRRLHERLSLVH